MKSQKVYREKPFNLNSKDEYMFEHEYIKVFEKFHIKIFSNITIFNNIFYFKGVFRFKSRYWRMNEYSKKQKIIFFINDIYKFFKNVNNPVEVINEGIWVTDQKSHQYFHWIADVLPRIEGIIKQNDININNIPIVLPENYKKNKYITDLIDIYKLRPIYLEKDINYKFNKLIVSSHAAPAGNFDEQLIKSQSYRLKSLIETDHKFKNKRIWISRQIAEKRKISNFEEIERILKEYDFEIFEFENISIEEQFKIVKNADTLGGIHGAGLVNMLLMDSNCKIIEVRGNGDKVNNCFFSLSSALNLKYFYFLAEVENKNFFNSNYYIEPSKFEFFLEQTLSK